jgi:hypothetical protein
MKEIGPDKYHHHKHLDAMEKVIKGMEALGTSLRKDDNARTLQTIWREYHAFTAHRCR